MLAEIEVDLKAMYEGDSMKVRSSLAPATCAAERSPSPSAVFGRSQSHLRAV